MKEANSIVVKGNAGDNVLSISLFDVLQEIKNGELFTWGLLWITALGDLGENRSILDFEKDVNESEQGMIIHWSELLTLASRFEQVIELLLIGSYIPKKVKRYSDDKLMYVNCNYTIELVDSSYWIIHSTSENDLKTLKDVLPGSEYSYII